METSKGTHPVIPLNEDYEKFIFNERNIDEDCDYIAHLMWDEVEVIEQLAADGQYMEAAMKFMQMTKSMCRHFVLDEHYCFFDDMYSPEYAIFNLVELFNGLAENGQLSDDGLSSTVGSSLTKGRGKSGIMSRISDGESYSGVFDVFFYSPVASGELQHSPRLSPFMGKGLGLAG